MNNANTHPLTPVIELPEKWHVEEPKVTAGIVEMLRDNNLQVRLQFGYLNVRGENFAGGKISFVYTKTSIETGASILGFVLAIEKRFAAPELDNE